jgi:hypothetical protein
MNATLDKFPEITTRLKRAQGQLAAVMEMMESGRPSPMKAGIRSRSWSAKPLSRRIWVIA